MRLPRGMYEAVSEVAKQLGVDKSQAAGVLLGFGLMNVRPSVFSEATQAHLLADAMETVALILRAAAAIPKARREKEWKDFFETLTKMRNMLAHDESQGG